jgi:hypothetical protein
MIVPLVYKEISQQNLAEEIASNLGTTASTNQQLISQSHFYLSEAGLSFFHPEARSSNKLLIDFNSGSTGWRVKRSSHEKLIKKAFRQIRSALKYFRLHGWHASRYFIISKLGSSSDCP